MSNINTKQYWDDRFKSGDWEMKQGRQQTTLLAKSQIKHIEINSDFSGTILDFGCGFGDAIPIYRERFPLAKFIGLDISETAIEKCKQKYGDIATFICGDYSIVPDVDIILASNVFEHLSNDKNIAKSLMSKCNILFIIVPYKEVLIPNNEHINSYVESSFEMIGNCKTKIFISRGWTQFGFKLIYHIYLKNLIKLLIGKPIMSRSKQIMFKIT